MSLLAPLTSPSMNLSPRGTYAGFSDTEITCSIPEAMPTSSDDVSRASSNAEQVTTRSLV